MNMRIVANSNALVAIGFTMFLGGIVGSLALLNFWLLLLIPISLVFMLHLETDADRVELSELKKRGARVVVSQQKVYGVFGDYFVQAMLTGEHLNAAKSLMDRSADSWLDSGNALTDNLPANMRVWPLSQIDQVKFSSDAKSFSILTNLKHSEVQMSSPDERDKVLKTLKSKIEWGIETSYRKVLKMRWLVAIASLLGMFFSIALILTATGILQPQQMPLATWDDVERAHGKAKGVLAIYAVCCQAFLFLVTNLHPIAAFVLGVASTYGLGNALKGAQWSKVADVTWRRQLNNAVTITGE